MARWAPGAADRLQRAAMELFARDGFPATTVAGIAARAGLTERTFFRHFTDKREVLFHGEEQLENTCTDAIAAVPAGASMPRLLGAGLDAVGSQLRDLRGRDHCRARNEIIAANELLYERELLKLATLSGAVAGALVARDVAEVSARLAGDVLVSVFGAAFRQWIAPDETRDLVELQHEYLITMSRVTSVPTA